MSDATTQPSRFHPEFRLETAEAQPVLGLSLAPATASRSQAAQRSAYVISQAGVPRWILPEKTRSALTVLKSWKPYSLKSFAQWKVILAGCRWGALPAIPGILEGFVACDPAYWGAWLPEFTDEWSVVAYVGHPSPTRKAIVFFVDESARVKAVGKVPISQAARAAILNEADILRALQHRLPLPEVLFSDREEGIAGQSWVEGMHVSSKFAAEQLLLLSSLSVEGLEIRLSDFRDSLAGDLASQDLPAEPLLLKKALGLLEVNSALPAFTEHRDCVPWNMRRLADGRLTLIDWEWAVAEGLPWQDICRYFYFQDYLFKKSANVWETLSNHSFLEQYRTRFALSIQTVRGLTAHFLLRSMCEDHAEGQTDRANYMQRKIQELIG